MADPPFLVPRTSWGARHPKSLRPLTGFTSGWFIHWLGEPAAAGLPDDQVLRNTQRYHMDTKAWADIAYSFAVGRQHPDRAYELRGWGIQGGHTEGHNSQSMAIVFLLGTGERPNETMLATARALIAEGARRGYPAGLVRPHNAVRSTACPGPDLTTWVKAGRFTPQETTVPPPATTNPYPAATAEALELLAQHAGYTDPDRKWFGPLALEALHRLKNRAGELSRQLDEANRAGASALSELATARAVVARAEHDLEEAQDNRESAEAEALQLRRQLQTGGRLPQLLADIDAALAKARA